MENIHSETYSLLIDTMLKMMLKKRLLSEVFPAIKRIGPTVDRIDSFAERLIAFAAVDFFSGAFCSIYWLKKRGLMPD
jgi:ribonucleotide reductase beta subunit family protein with ferritin-like domain